MTSTTFTSIRSRQVPAGFTSVVQQALTAAMIRYRRHVTRREVPRLNASQLRDIGLDPAQVSPEPAYQTDPRTMINLLSMR